MSRFTKKFILDIEASPGNVIRKDGQRGFTSVKDFNSFIKDLDLTKSNRQIAREFLKKDPELQGSKLIQLAFGEVNPAGTVTERTIKTSKKALGALFDLDIYAFNENGVQEKLLNAIKTGGMSRPEVLKEFFEGLIKEAKTGRVGIGAWFGQFDLSRIFYQASLVAQTPGNAKIGDLMREVMQLMKANKIGTFAAEEPYNLFRASILKHSEGTFLGGRRVTKAPGLISSYRGMPYRAGFKADTAAKNLNIQAMVSHLAGADVEKERLIYSLLSKYKTNVDPYEFLKANGVLPAEINSREVFYNQYARKFFYNEGKDVSGKVRVNLAKGITGEAAKDVVKLEANESRIGLNLLKSNKGIKIAAAGALAIAGAYVVKRLLFNDSIDDRSNTIEALRGSSHKGGFFGSGFLGANPDWVRATGTGLKGLFRVQQQRDPNYLLVGASYTGLPVKDIKEKLMPRKEGEAKEDLKGYQKASAEFGTLVHQLEQRKALREGSATAIESAVSSPAAGIHGVIDITKGNVLVEVKTVSSGIFKKLQETQKPYPSHLMQINAYMGMLGKTKGQLVYINRENLSQRLTFDLDFGSEMFELTKKKVSSAQLAAMRQALKKGIPLEELSRPEGSFGPTSDIPSEAYLKSRYPVELFHVLTMKRTIPKGLDELKQHRSKIEAMGKGWFGSQRSEDTDFGSGFGEAQEERPDLTKSRAVALGLLGTGAYMYKKHPETLYKWLQQAEEKSPFQIFKTFRLTEKLSSRIIHTRNAEYDVDVAKGLYRKERLHGIGHHYKRMLGEEFTTAEKISYKRAEGELFEVVGGTVNRFGEREATHAVLGHAGTRRAAQAATWYQPVTQAKDLDWKKFDDAAKKKIEELPEFIKSKLGGEDSPIYRLAKNFHKARASQAERMLAREEFSDVLVPIYKTTAKTKTGRAFDIFQQRMRRSAFGGFQRLNRLAAEVGLGVEERTYNRLLTLPFHEVLAGTKFGEKIGLTKGAYGLLNRLFMRRFLPGAAIAGALGYLDYKSDHVVSNLPIHAYAKSKIGLARLAEVSGLRAADDWLHDVSPFPDYGPVLAFPAIGATYGLLRAAKLAKSEEGIRKGLVELGKDIGKYTTYGKYAEQEASSIITKTFSTAYQDLRSGLMKKGAKWGLIAAAPFLLATIIPNKRSRELADIYYGGKEIPIMKSRGWETSSTPYSGDKVKEYRQHWLYRHMNRIGIKNEYGSEEEYWKRSLLTPIGWFNLLVDPYGEEKAAWKRGRRFPLTKEVLTDVPFPMFGPTIGRWIGRAFKPMRYMGVSGKEELQQMYLSEHPELEPSKRLGGTAPLLPQDPGSAKNILADALEQGTQAVGLPGYLGQTAAKKLTGKTNPLIGDEPRIQTANEINDWSKRYYGAELGGGFFRTELARRFLQKAPREIEEYNPIANNMPSWLSGENELVKLGRGDVYSKVGSSGQWVPGPEYNKRVGLPENLNPEDYPDIHKLAILSHLQPYSKKIPRLITSLESQKLTPEEKYLIEAYKRQVKDVKNPEKFTERKFTAEVAQYTGTIQSIAPEGVTFEEYPYKTFQLAGLKLNPLDIADNLMYNSRLDKNTALQKAEELSWQAKQFIANSMKPGQAVSFIAEKYAPENLNQAEIILGGLNQQVANKFGIPYEPSGALAQVGRSGATKMVGQLLETVSHDSPVPMISKFMGAYDPIEKYKKEQVYGRKIRRWDRPYRDFINSYAWGTARRAGEIWNAAGLPGLIGKKAATIADIAGLTGNVQNQFGAMGDSKGSGLVPGFTNDVRTNQEYFDKLEYIKNVRLAKRAEQAGDKKLVGYFMSQARMTMIGANPITSEPESLVATLPKNERPYFLEFVKEADPNKRREILELVPHAERRLLLGQWFRQKTHANMDENEFAQYRDYVASEGYANNVDPRYINDIFSRHQGDTDRATLYKMGETTQFLQQNNLSLPNDSWVGWSENSDMEDIKLMYLRSIGEDIHEYNLWEDRDRELARKPYLAGSTAALKGGFDYGKTLETMDTILAGNNVVSNRLVVMPSQEKKVDIKISLNPDSLIADSDFTEAVGRSLKRTRDGFDPRDLYFGV